MPTPPKVFISYTHDSDTHKQNVLALSERLRQEGVEAQIDQYDPIKPEGLQRWMLNKIDWADYVILVCTEQYHQKFLGKEGGGAEFESGLVLDHLFADKGENRKFLTVGFVPFEHNPGIPQMLKRWTYFDVSTEAGYEQLYRRLTEQPEIIAAPLGSVRTLHPKNATTVIPERPQPEQTATGLTPEMLDALFAIGENKDNLRRLIEQLESNGRSNLLPFVGAGVSIPLGFASWRIFLLDQAKRAGIETQILQRLDAGEYEEAAQDLLDKRKFRAFHDAIGNEYGEHKLQGKNLTGAVAYLPRLASGPVITTNFDRVLETTFEQASTPFTEKVWGARYADVAAEALSRSERILLKLHGDYRDSHDRILTKSDYDTSYSKEDGSGIDFSKPLPKLLHQMLIGRTLLFVGCSLKDDRTVTVLEQVVINFRSIAHYAIVEQPPAQDEFYERDSFLSEHNIRPIWYPTGHHEYIEQILAFLASKANP